MDWRQQQKDTGNLFLKGQFTKKYKFGHNLLTLKFFMTLFFCGTHKILKKYSTTFVHTTKVCREQNNVEPHFLKSRFRMTSWPYWLCMIIWLAFSIVFFTLLSKTPPPPPPRSRSHLRTKKKQSSLLEIRIGCINEQFKSVISQNPKSSVSLICFVANKWSKKETY